MMENAAPLENLSFEQAYTELESIVQKLDSGELTLEDSVALYERGRQLSAHCQSLLDKAELRVSVLDEQS